MELLGFYVDALVHERNLLVHSWDIEYMPIAKNQMREIMLKDAWMSGTGEKGKSSEIGIVYDAYADNEKLSVRVEDRKAKKVFRFHLNLASLDQILFLRSDPKLTFSSHGFMVNSKSSIHDWVQAIRGMRELLVKKEISDSNVWKLASACDKLGVPQDQIGTIVSKNLFPAGSLKWEEWVEERINSLKSKSSSKASNGTKTVAAAKANEPESIPSTSRTNQGLEMTHDLVMPITMVEPDDNFPEAPLLLKNAEDAVLAPAQKSKPKRKLSTPVDIRDNILLHEDEPDVNIDPNDDDEIHKEAEKIKDLFLRPLSDTMKIAMLSANAQVLSSEFKLDFEGIAKLTALLRLKKPTKATSSRKGSKGEPQAKRAKGDDGVEDRTFENRLQYIWINTRGTPSEKTAHPWFIAPFHEDMVYEDHELPHLKDVSLVFVDLARNLQFKLDATILYLMCKNVDKDNSGGDWSSALSTKADAKVELSFHVDNKKDYDLHLIKRESEGYQPPLLADAGVDISTQPVILAVQDPELDSERDFEDMMDPEMAFCRKRGIQTGGQKTSSAQSPALIRRDALGNVIPGGLGPEGSERSGQDQVEVSTASRLVPTCKSGAQLTQTAGDSTVPTAFEGCLGVQSKILCRVSPSPKGSVVRRLSEEFIPIVVQSSLQVDFVPSNDDDEEAQEIVRIDGEDEVPQAETISGELGGNVEDKLEEVDNADVAKCIAESNLDDEEATNIRDTVPAKTLLTASTNHPSPDDDEQYNYGLQKAGAFTKTFDRLVIKNYPKLKKAPIGSRSSYPSVSYHNHLTGIGLVSSDLSASLTEMNLEVDEYGSMDPLVLSPTTITSVDLNPKSRAEAQPHVTSDVQGSRKVQAKAPSGPNPTKNVKKPSVQPSRQGKRGSGSQVPRPIRPKEAVKSLKTRVPTRTEKK
ncbi:hypothetical protein R1sor_005333 [Riccia sorocarpa]|uniref:PH domain-containing protein n=1 Tax=Riccia sorocarpa TaxID=122646 RepID=A0ABD3HJH1_9MARC